MIEQDQQQGVPPGTSICKHCERPYKARRSDQQFCGAKCRVYASRPPQNAYNSPTKKRQGVEFFDTAGRLGERLYSQPISERLGFMEGLIQEARQGNTMLREILSNVLLRHPNPVTQRWMFPRSSPAYCTISQAAEYYCKKVWRADVKDVVYCKVSEPPTGEVLD
jgi:hypothetical protein